jgi:hypothetical protein
MDIVPRNFFGDHTGDGLRKHARDLYDPGQAVLAGVFKDKPIFPVQQFASPAWLEVSVSA